MRADPCRALPRSLLAAPARVLRPLASRLRTRPVLGRLVLNLVPNLPVRLRVPSIGPFSIRLRQHRSYWLRDPLESERVPFSLLRTMVAPGDVVYDVGANIGLYTRLFSTLGAREIVAFEPVAANRRLHRQNMVLGGVEGARCLPWALSDRDEEAEFQVDDMQSTSGTLDRVSGGAAAEGRRNLRLPPKTERVACRSLDSLIGAGEIPPPDLMKLDVEGAEALVLRGGLKTLRQHRPRLVIEIHGAGVAREVATLLLDEGFACRGWMIPALAPSRYGAVTRDLLPRLQGLYDLRFLAAAMDPEQLPRAI